MIRDYISFFFRLVALVETLQKRKLRHNKRPQSQPHALENITIALDAIQEDGIKLVNIGWYSFWVSSYSSAWLKSKLAVQSSWLG